MTSGHDRRAARRQLRRRTMAPVQLAYGNVSFDRRSLVMSKEDKEEMRRKQGLCLTCEGIPVQLYDIKRSKLNPLWSSKHPRTVEGEAKDGQCLKCCPWLSPSSRALRRGSSTRSQLQQPTTATMTTTTATTTATQTPTSSAEHVLVVPKNEKNAAASVFVAEEKLQTNRQQGGGVRRGSCPEQRLLPEKKNNEEYSFSASCAKLPVHLHQQQPPPIAVVQRNPSFVNLVPAQQQQRPTVVREHSESTSSFVLQPQASFRSVCSASSSHSAATNTSHGLSSMASGCNMQQQQHQQERRSSSSRGGGSRRSLADHFSATAPTKPKTFNCETDTLDSSFCGLSIDEPPAPPNLLGGGYGAEVEEDNSDDNNDDPMVGLRAFIENMQDTEANFNLIANTLVDSMITYRAYEQVQIFCLSTIAQSLQGSADHDWASKSEDLMSFRAHKVVMLAMKKHPSSLDVLEQGISVLASLSRSETARVVLAREGVCDCILQAMTSQNIRDASLVCGALNALLALASEPKAYKAFHRLSASKVVVRAMQCNPYQSRVQGDGCALLAVMAMTIVTNPEQQQQQEHGGAATSGAADVVLDHDALDTVVHALRVHNDDRTTAANACLVLKIYASEDESKCRRLRCVEGIFDLLERSCELLGVRDARLVLDKLGESGDQDRMMEDQVYESLLAMVELQSEQPGLVGDVMNVLESFSWSNKVTAACLLILRTLATNSDLHRENLIMERRRIHHLIVAHMEEGSAAADPLVLEQADRLDACLLAGER